MVKGGEVMSIGIKNTDFKLAKLLSYKADIKLWGKKAEITVKFPKDKSPGAYLDMLIGNIKEQLVWVENERSTIEKKLTDYGYILLAEDWVSTLKRAINEEQECYITKDGEKIFLPITEEDFSESLYLDKMSVNFRRDLRKPELELFLRCNPDYFRNYALRIRIDDEKK